MAALTNDQLHQLARLGAQARLAQLDAEIAAIKAAYPELAGGAAPGGGTAPARARRGRKAAAKRGKRGGSHMSPEARRAQSERMTKLWEARRKAKAAAGK